MERGEVQRELCQSLPVDVITSQTALGFHVDVNLTWLFN